ncbi:hypothetical protein CRUP_029888, partial [Coryphaenoides rupestris]
PSTTTTTTNNNNTTNDDNNNPSEAQAGGGGSPEGRGDADGSSVHSGDSIDFFSAREKFLGLALDGRGARAAAAASTPPPPLSDRTQQPRTPSPSPSPSLVEEPGERREEEEQRKEMNRIPPCSEDHQDKCSPDATPQHDNAVSVRHIVTEIESISHLPPATVPASSPAPPCRSPTQPRCPDHLLEDRETGEVTGDRSPTPPPMSSPSTPAQPPPDWPAG